MNEKTIEEAVAMEKIINGALEDVKEDLEVRSFRIYAKVVKLDDEESFITCSAKINDKYYKVRFRMTCPDYIKEYGVYEIKLKEEMINISRGKTYKTKDGIKGKENDTLWIKDYISLVKLSDEDLDKENRESVSDVFTSKEVNYFKNNRK